ncbi:transcriptional regulator [Desulfosporosinus acidiphilus SJ4]|uniref:Transcriptional regulator n=1 Tax=Desulfosporosinus acidiphilus (strain DSM 22704 / JCM 16185 / SJ4) TaxID=646529 RepID=I4D9K5_DESAJ|nr:TetR/AcrR family transcriptional regulator [Desulfosporosinus acidiphilus]AFM42479.1 transcriptional regulator [Desulfosporosinus acidiphilus SJ4]
MDNREKDFKKIDGRGQRSEESRGRILSSATRIFAEKGLDGARIDEIAEDAGINKRMLYHYYGSKEDLYVEVLRYNYEKIYTLSKNAFNLGDDPKENVTRAVRAYFYFLAQNEDFVRLTSWEALNRGRFAKKVIPQFFDLVELEFVDIIKNGIKRNFIRPDTDIRQVIVSVQALCLAYFNRREIVQPLWQEDLLSEEMLEVRLQHILALIFDGIFSHKEE